MGFFDSITGFLGKVADGVTHTIAPGLDFKPSSLLKQASKLLPGLTELIPGVGPIVSKGISAVESIVGGHDATDPDTSSTSPPTTVLPGISEVKDLIQDTANAITKTSADLSERLDKIDEHLSSKLDTVDVDIKATIKEETLKTDALITEHTRKVLDAVHSLDENAQIREDKAWRKTEHKSLKDKYENYRESVSLAINYWDEHVTKLHELVAYGESETIKHYLEGSSSPTMVSRRDALRDVVQKMQEYMIQNQPPTQEIFDLYVLAVTWLLTYDKAILTLCSYWAHSLFVNSDSNNLLEYFHAREIWNDDLEQAIRDAKNRANFLLGAPLLNKPSFIDTLWEYRQKSIWSVEQYHEKERDRAVGYFFDRYPTYGMGAAKFDLAYWRIDLQAMIVVLTGTESNYEDDHHRVSATIKGLHAGYCGLQTAYFQAATRVAREMAHSWRISADRWQTNSPLSPPLHSSDLVAAWEATRTAEHQEHMIKNGLCEHDWDRGTGYKKGDRIKYFVSYVTNHGEGRISVEPPEALEVQYDNSFMLVTVKPVKFSEDKGLTNRQDARNFEKDILAHVVRRIYVKVGSTVRHVIDISAPYHKEVFVWDLGDIAIRAEKKVSPKTATAPKPPVALPDIGI